MTKPEPLMREGDIEALRRKRELEGKPIKSDLIRKGDRILQYRAKNGRVEVLGDND